MIPLVNGYAEAGDCIQVVALTFDSPNCEHNLAILRDDLEALASDKGFDVEVVSIEAPFDNSPESVLEDFQKLIACVADDDVLHACITFGSKPMTLAMTMALRYATQVMHNVRIECVVYGEQDYRSDPPTGKIYDMTVLFRLDELVTTLAGRGISDPKSMIGHILSM